MWPIEKNKETAISLGVNIDHIATLRNARDTNYPDIIAAALIAEEAGADLITVHLREDRRHIRDKDVLELKSSLKTSMNFECAATEAMLSFACHLQPAQVCLVPESRKELTTEGGLDVIGCFVEIVAACKRLQAANIKPILFIDPVESQIVAAYKAGAYGIELHTGNYANAIEITNVNLELELIKKGVVIGLRHGLSVHAGHGLHYENVAAIAHIRGISELHIGYAIVAQAIFTGWRTAVHSMKTKIIEAF